MSNYDRTGLDPYEAEASEFLKRLGCNDLILGKYYFCHDNNRLQLPIYDKSTQKDHVEIIVRDSKHRTKRIYRLYYFFVDRKDVRALTEIKISTDTEIDFSDRPTLLELKTDIAKFSDSSKNNRLFNLNFVKDLYYWFKNKTLRLS